MNENESILTRLQAQKATYSVEGWNSDFQKHEYYRSKYSEFAQSRPNSRGGVTTVMANPAEYYDEPIDMGAYQTEPRE